MLLTLHNFFSETVKSHYHCLLHHRNKKSETKIQIQNHIETKFSPLDKSKSETPKQKLSPIDQQNKTKQKIKSKIQFQNHVETKVLST